LAYGEVAGCGSRNRASKASFRENEDPVPGRPGDHATFCNRKVLVFACSAETLSNAGGTTTSGGT